MTDRTGRMNQPIEIRKTPQAHANLMTSTKDCTSHAHPGPTMIITTSTTSCKTVSDVLHKVRARAWKHPNTKL